MRHALDGGRARADDADALVAELGERRTERIAARVVVIPAAGVKGMALEILDAGNSRKLRHMQRSRAQTDELRGEFVAAIGADDPPLGGIFPFDVGHFGVEERVVVKTEFLSDALAMFEDLWRMRI